MLWFMQNKENQCNDTKYNTASNRKPLFQMITHNLALLCIITLLFIAAFSFFSFTPWDLLADWLIVL